MKIAIKANPSRGKEIISLLESLGGNKASLSGDGKLYTYYIEDNNVIRYNDAPKDYKVYTLEEFEKEFPFKIGDEVTIIGLPDFPKVITKMVWDCDEILYSFEGLNNTWFGAKSLKKFEMKEERNITLTLDKAKEWYKKGGELKEIALQAFTEKELTKVELPKTWEEYAQQNFHREGYVLTHLGDIAETTITGSQGGKNLCSSKKSAKAHLAMIQLEQLRDCWWGDWKPEWEEISDKYCITMVKDSPVTGLTITTSEFLTFPTLKMAEEFLKCFRDLIEKAGDLI